MSDEENDPIYDRLGLAPISNKAIELVPVNKTNGETLEDDLDTVRSNVNDILEKGLGAFDEIAKIAKSSQDPKAYREVSVLLKVLAEANRTLVDVTKARHEIKSNRGKVVDPDAPPQIVNQTANFYGSTTDALEMLRNKNAQSEDGQE